MGFAGTLLMDTFRDYFRQASVDLTRSVTTAGRVATQGFQHSDHPTTLFAIPAGTYPVAVHMGCMTRGLKSLEVGISFEQHLLD
jgi:hypothetical protein